RARNLGDLAILFPGPELAAQDSAPSSAAARDQRAPPPGKADLREARAAPQSEVVAEERAVSAEPALWILGRNNDTPVSPRVDPVGMPVDLALGLEERLHGDAVAPAVGASATNPARGVLEGAHAHPAPPGDPR